MCRKDAAGSDAPQIFHDFFRDKEAFLMAGARERLIHQNHAVFCEAGKNRLQPDAFFAQPALAD